MKLLASLPSWNRNKALVVSLVNEKHKIANSQLTDKRNYYLIYGLTSDLFCFELNV